MRTVGGWGTVSQVDSEMQPVARTWRPWTWVGIIGGATVHTLLMFLATALVALDTEGVCHEPAASGELGRARLLLTVVVMLSAGPWLPGLVTAFRHRRHRLVLVAAASVVTLFPAWYLVSALLASPADWTMDWCLF
jgi:hypothetical protein